MNEITIEVFTHVIITHKDGHYPITEEQNQQVLVMGLDDLIVVEGGEIKGSSIAEVMTMEQYYKTFPEKKPDPHARPAANEYNYKQIHEAHLVKIKTWTRSEMLEKHKKLQDYIREQDSKKIPVGYHARCLATDLLQAIKYQEEK